MSPVDTIPLMLHSIDSRSRVNGPGVRFTIWFQGCSLSCPDCFNPDTHDPDGGLTLSVADLLARIEANQERVDGVTITGGEPFDQVAALSSLLEGIRQRTRLPVIVFTGYTLEQIRGRPGGDEILGWIDVLIDGPYRHGQRSARALRGSENQRIHCLTDRYRVEDFDDIAAAELTVEPEGRITISGIDPPRKKKIS